MTEEQIQLLERTANLLRGVCMDPRVPQDTRDALWSARGELEAAAAAALAQESDGGVREGTNRTTDGSIGQP